jgi:integrase
MSRKFGLPKYCSAYRDAHGTLRVKFRTKDVSTYIKARPIMGEAFLAEYHALLAGEDPRAERPVGAERTKPGSVNALAVSFYSSGEWAALADQTKVTYRGIIERFREEHGDKRVAMLRRQHVQKMIDAKAATPHAANNLLNVLRVLMKHALRKNMIDADPCRDVQRVRAKKTEGFHSWTEEEIAQFEAFYPFGTRERLCLALHLYTGQRPGDVARMGPQHLRGDAISVEQQKTGARLEIPLHPDLARAICEAETGDMAFLANKRTGQPLGPKYLQNWWQGVIERAGLPQRCVRHGLRKAAARRLAEAGCTVWQIAAITGHTTLKEVERYTRAADQKANARAAFRLLDGTQTERNLSTLPEKVDKTQAK